MRPPANGNENARALAQALERFKSLLPTEIIHHTLFWADAFFFLPRNVKMFENLVLKIASALGTCKMSEKGCWVADCPAKLFFVAVLCLSHSSEMECKPNCASH